MRVEFWVCKVLLHPGPMKRSVKLREMSPAAQLVTLARVQSGDLAVLPDGCIIEPLLCFEQGPQHEQGLAQREAEEDCRKRMHDDPGGDYRVIINSDGL